MISQWCVCVCVCVWLFRLYWRFKADRIKTLYSSNKIIYIKGYIFIEMITDQKTKKDIIFSFHWNKISCWSLVSTGTRSHVDLLFPLEQDLMLISCLLRRFTSLLYWEFSNVAMPLRNAYLHVKWSTARLSNFLWSTLK
jgi:hypothetical protein